MGDKDDEMMERGSGIHLASPDAEASTERNSLQSEHYRLIFNSSALGIISTDLEGKFLDANPAFCRMLGYSLDELLQLNIAAITHPDDLPGNMKVRQEVLSGREGSEIFEKRYLHKSGASIWARLVGSPLYDGRGAMTGLFAMVENIHQRKLATEELARMQAEIAASEERLRYITRASLDFFWDWDLVSNTIWWGDNLHARFGFTRTMMGADERFWLRRAHRDDRQKMIRAYQSVLRGDTDSWHLTIRVKKLDGNFATVEERAFAIRDASGRVLRIVCGITDISARLELEERLQQSQRLESLGQLTGGVAHDFNNLLTVMLGNAELLSNSLESQPDLRDLANAIVRSALQGADLTHRLLAFSRRQALEPRNVNLNHLLDNMGRILVRTLGEDIDFQRFPAANLWLCEVDPNQLEAAILNLCLNARDAMPTGGKLVIETSNAVLDTDYTDRHFDLDPGEYVCLAVSDSGIGIPPENLERVLEPFFTTKSKDKGTGLGLSMAFGFAKQSRGHLTLYSEAGEGTTVKLYLPRSNPGASEDVPQANRPAANSDFGETILLVEDDDLVRRYAETQLRSLGYRVHAAANGPQALSLLVQHDDIKLLFTDVVMSGGMGGGQLAEAACARRPGLKVLFTSGYTENSILHNGRLDPGVHLLGKPYQRHELAAKLREVLDSL